MAETTKNYGLTKPSPEDFYDVGVQNNNMDIIDAELKKRTACLATYYPVDSAKNADELVDAFALVPVSLDVNAELFDIVGGTFAWVWTNFHVQADVTSRRMQIAVSYDTENHKMAFRIYGTDGWLEWKELVTMDNIPEYEMPTTSDIGALSDALPTITDADESIATTDTCVKIERWTKNTLNTPYTAGLVTNNEGVIITTSAKNLYATQLAFPLGGRRLFIRPNIAGSIYDWSEFGDFKADGSKAISGKVLNMQNGKGSFEVNGSVVGMRVRETANDDTNSVRLTIDDAYALYRKLFLRVTENGTNKDYKIYGEHNKPTAEDVGAYSKAEVDELIASTSNITTGSYVGTGTHGADNKNNLTFSFEPKFIFIQREKSASSQQFVSLVYGSKFYGQDVTSYTNVEWDGNTVRWWTTNNDAKIQYNESNTTYRYIAIG